MAFNWTCPNCGSHTTLQSPNFDSSIKDIFVGTATADEAIRFTHLVIKCPNPACHKFTISTSAAFFPKGENHNGYPRIPDNSKKIRDAGPGSFRFEPRVGQPMSIHVPASCSSDYEEACLILDISPKAAATLCRRALQGMIRDFWGISKPTLAGELRAIEAQCEPALYKALMSLKGIGNIGAHPERDINLIVDVEPDEVNELLELLRLLDAEWYVARAKRAERLSSIASIGAKKAALQDPNEGA